MKVKTSNCSGQRGLPALFVRIRLNDCSAIISRGLGISLKMAFTIVVRDVFCILDRYVPGAGCKTRLGSRIKKGFIYVRVWAYLCVGVCMGVSCRVQCAVDAGFMTTWKDLALYQGINHTWFSFIPGSCANDANMRHLQWGWTVGCLRLLGDLCTLPLSSCTPHYTHAHTLRE